MGLKIKGAARKEESLLSTESENNHHAGQRQAPTVNSSLMDRLALNGGMVIIDSHARRSKKRGMA